VINEGVRCLAMLRHAPAALLIAGFLLVAAPAALAQASTPADPTIAVSLEVAPKAPVVPLGGAQTFKVNVILSTNYIFCPNASTATVKLELKDMGLAGIVGTLPASVDVPLRANVQPPSATTTSGGNATALLEVTVARSTMPDHDHGFTVTATTPTAAPSGCNTISPNAPKAATASAEVTLRTGPAPLSTGTGTGSVSVGVGDCSANVSAPGVSVAASGTCTTKKSFFVPLQLELAVLLAVGLLRRRAA
jgi:hypothetical protein